MKHHLYLFIALVFSAFLLSNTNIQLKDCKCKNLELKGRVKIVTSGDDFRIKVVESQPDLRVKKVDRLPVECGEWQFVN